MFELCIIDWYETAGINSLCCCCLRKITDGGVFGPLYDFHWPCYHKAYREGLKKLNKENLS